MGDLGLGRRCIRRQGLLLENNRLCLETGIREVVRLGLGLSDLEFCLLHTAINMEHLESVKESTNLEILLFLPLLLCAGSHLTCSALCRADSVCLGTTDFSETWGPFWTGHLNRGVQCAGAEIATSKQKRTSANVADGEPAGAQPWR